MEYRVVILSSTVLLSVTFVSQRRFISVFSVISQRMRNMENLTPMHGGCLFKFLRIYTLSIWRVLRNIGRYLITDFLRRKLGPITSHMTSINNRQPTLLTFPEQRRPRPHAAKAWNILNDKSSCNLNVRPLHNKSRSQYVPRNAFELVKLSVRM